MPIRSQLKEKLHTTENLISNSRNYLDEENVQLLRRTQY